ncbi:hypothetical protein OPV22_024234 [Ensete ventricosum]|uniref:Uncharacterized protein n=1 Tax=Ensete ventricosum TaxID=4639 RepID=A0AAV8QNL2_ENSVE|nr:hypothetical protein OPV22_024234 [Ensete ventricosum]
MRPRGSSSSFSTASRPSRNSAAPPHPRRSTTRTLLPAMKLSRRWNQQTAPLNPPPPWIPLIGWPRSSRRSRSSQPTWRAFSVGGLDARDGSSSIEKLGLTVIGPTTWVCGWKYEVRKLNAEKRARFVKRVQGPAFAH